MHYARRERVLVIRAQIPGETRERVRERGGNVTGRPYAKSNLRSCTTSARVARGNITASAVSSRTFVEVVTMCTCLPQSATELL